MPVVVVEMKEVVAVMNVGAEVAVEAVVEVGVVNEEVVPWATQIFCVSFAW